MTYPKIGIRPTIDGRWGGVRESLEAQTMGMATAAKALIEENLHYHAGTVRALPHHHRRRRRGSQVRRILCRRECGRYPDGDPLLVLRIRDL